MTNLTGTPALVRLFLRRDRVRLTVWLVSIPGLVYAQAASIEGLYRPEDLVNAARLVKGNAAFIAMAGPAVALETFGGRVTFEISAFAIVLAALMNLFLVTRHVRAEEESGRAELVRSGAVGRHAPVTAALTLALLADLVLTALVALSMAPFGAPVAGAWALAAGIGGVGLVFAGVAAVTSQVTVSTRAASGLAGGVLAASFVVRAIGDIGTGTLSWLSPIGWGQALRPYAEERWWVLLVLVGASLVLAASAFWINSHRDLGAGLLQPGLGPARAAHSMSSPVGLPVRLLRAMVVAWAVSLFLGGLGYGSVSGDIEDFVGDNEVIADLIAQGGGDLLDSFLATTSLVLALVAAGFSIQAALRLRSEELADRAEPLLATPLSRVRWSGSHLSVVAAGSVLVLAAAGFGTALSTALVLHDAGDFGTLVGASLVYAPALLVLVALVGFLHGVAPGATSAAWGLLALFFVTGFLGQILSLPRWVELLSPFEHVPRLPAEPMSWLPLVVLLAVAAALAGAGAAGLRHRDIPR